MIINTEVHAIYTPSDVDMAAEAGLPVTIEDASCAECGDLLGDVSGSFVPFAVVLSELEEWLLCIDCANPAIQPRN